MAHLLRTAALLALLPGIAGADPLPALNLDPGATTVSGLSSGAFLAVQLQVAFSERIAGAGIVAGGPFGCADGYAYRALWICMQPNMGRPKADRAVAEIADLAADGRIDDPAHLAADRIYLFHGSADPTVDRIAMDALRESYALLGVPDGQITYVTDIPAGHGFVTENGPLTCGETTEDFLIDCDVDQAGDILTQLYSPLAPATQARAQGLLEVDQSLYLEGAVGMDEVAFVYVPETCEAGDLCRLHIALHGCNQGHEVIEEDYVRLTGYNRWAEANGIVVLYPQALKLDPPFWDLFSPRNPEGCWDWWGYSGSDYLSHDAPQMAAIARMADALGAPLTP